MSEKQCSVCRRLFPEEQIFTLKDEPVCAACKPVVLERLLTGAPEPLEPVGLSHHILSFWETITIGWKVIRTAWLPLLLLGLLVAIPLNFLLHQIPLPEEPTAREIGRYYRLQQFLQTLVGIVATLGFAWITQERLKGRRATLGGALLHALKRWLPGIGTAWLEGIFLLFFFLLLIVPGVIFAGYYAFSQISVSLRGRAGTGAFRYSKELVQGRWWRVVLYCIGYILPGLALIFIAGMISALLPESTYFDITTDILSDLVLGVCTIFMTVLFLNLEAYQRERASLS